jgi:hypothetical protein
MTFAATAQGITAQVRVLGGSIGIAASTAILGVTEGRELAGVVSASQLASLQSAADALSPAQWQAVQQAYSDSFNEALRVCAIVAAVAVLAAIASFQRDAPDVAEINKKQIIKERQRQQDIKARKDKSSG